MGDEVWKNRKGEMEHFGVVFFLCYLYQKWGQKAKEALKGKKGDQHIIPRSGWT